jgi:ubiquinone/menaquinone biosynthesis C-methylase UbiE
MKQNEIIDLYDKMASNYDKLVFTDKDYIAYKKIPKWIIQSLKLKNRTEILDLGCGTGLSSLELFKKGYFVTGIDISSKMVEEAKKLPFNKLYCQSLEEPLLFPSETFDAAQILGVMEFIQDPAKLFSEVYRVLKTDGLFGITIPKKLSKNLEETLQIFTYTQDEIECVFKKSNFSVKTSETFQGFISEGITIEYMGYLLKK